MLRALRLAPLAALVSGVLCARDAATAPLAPPAPAPPAPALSLTGTLRRIPPPPAAPVWLEEAVCARAPDLDCAAVARAVHEEAAAAGVDPVVVLAMIEVESAWDPAAISPRGARGLLQLRPSTARDEARRSRLGAIDPHDPVGAIRGGVRYFARMARWFGDADLALVAYNAGPARLRRHLAAGALPARFLSYPRRVNAEARRLRDVLDAPREELAMGGPAAVPPVGAIW